MLSLPLSPATTLALLLAGLSLIYVELNRPGLVVPGAAGLLALLLAVASIARGAHPAISIPMFALALLAAFADTRRPSWALALLSAIAFLWSVLAFPGQPSHAFAVAAAFGAVAFSLVTHRLARIAHRARTNKWTNRPGNGKIASGKIASDESKRLD